MKLIEKIKECFRLLKSFEQKDGSFKSSVNLSPIDETRSAIFSINLLEDLTQDLIFYYKVQGLNPITKIYQTLKNFKETFKLILCKIEY